MIDTLLHENPHILILAPSDTYAEHLAQHNNILFLPAWEHPPYSRQAWQPSRKQLRIKALHALQHPCQLVTTYAALAQATMPATLFRDLLLEIKQGIRLHPDILENVLRARGYRQAPAVQEFGSFARSVEQIDVFSAYGPYRISFFDDEVESIRSFCPHTQRSLQEMNDVLIITPAREVLYGPKHRSAFKDRCDTLGISRPLRDEILHAVEKSMYPLPHAESEFLAGLIYEPSCAWQYTSPCPLIILDGGDDLQARIQHEQTFSPMHTLWMPFESFYVDTNKRSGKNYPTEKLPDLPQHGAQHHIAAAPSLGFLRPGDYVVHKDAGIGLFQGIEHIAVHGSSLSDFFTIEYAEKTKLYVPLFRANALSVYQGGAPKLSTLGSSSFQEAKSRAKEALETIAIKLIAMYQARMEAKSDIHLVMGPDEEALFKIFVRTFPYHMTQDQARATEEVLQDLTSGRMMDRLICGDVGTGKTEVAMRAACWCALAGKQVIVLAPTSILAAQHVATFRARFQDLPITIGMLTRKTQDLEALKQSWQTGKIDILIATHRVLSSMLVSKDLGLCIIDEEHKFGVEQKQKILALRHGVHVLTLTATPIPRTLHMALARMRDMSLMTTYPQDRLPITTSVMPFDPTLVRDAIRQEFARDGQVFYLHNRIKQMKKAEQELQKLVPEAKIACLHGRLSEDEQEKVLESFLNGTTNLLLCSSIIESGIDIPRANTLIVDRADTFGLAQLYQMRGRVGRSNVPARAYFLTESGLSQWQALSDSKNAAKRLEALERASSLGQGMGAGFALASADLDIRGAGSLFGADQSGHTDALGMTLYTEMLESAMQGTPRIEPDMILPFPAFLPSNYVPAPEHRLDIYGRLARTQNIDAIIDEVQDRFGRLPENAINLFETMKIRNLLADAGIPKLSMGALKMTLTLPSGNHALWKKVSSQCTGITSDGKCTFTHNAMRLQELYAFLYKLIV